MNRLVKGTILYCDYKFAALVGYQNPSEIEGLNIHGLIPSLIIPETNTDQTLPKNLRKQRCTGHTKDGAIFPLSIYLEPEVESYSHLSISDCSNVTETNLAQSIVETEKSPCQREGVSFVDEEVDSRADDLCCSNDAKKRSNEIGGKGDVISHLEDANACKDSVYTGVIWVFANISGMITLRPDGTIHSCNHYFGLMLFGYPQNQLIGKNISYLIPSFYDDQEFLDTDSALFPPYEGGEDDLEDDISLDEVPSSTVDMAHNLANKLNSVHLNDYGTKSEKYISSEYADNTPTISRLVPAKSGEIPSYPTAANENEQFCALNNTKDSKRKIVGTHGLKDADINGNPPKTGDMETMENLKVVMSNSKGLPSDATKEDLGEHYGVRVREDCYHLDGSHPAPSNDLASNDMGSSQTLTQCSHSSSSSRADHLIFAYGGSSVTCSNSAFGAVLPGPPSTEHTQKHCCTSTPSVTPVKLHSVPRILEGSYFGLGRHRDGSDLAIVYQVRAVELDDGQVLYCMWVSRDPDEPADGFRLNSHVMASSLSSCADISSSVLSSGQVGSEHKHLGDVSSQSSVDYSTADCTRGVYLEHYTTLEQIGKGAFGCVKLAYRNSDNLLVVTKFIRKAKVYKECWVEDNILQKMMPLEVSLLTTLNHPNIVRVLDVFENEDFFQMVMEKHGCGMDLFDFIDRGPNMDEPLASYIFRQVVSAVSYLHSLNIAHRDIKDENIILDEKFHIKLIDFGSATFMSPTRVFSTFCGTIEYCSPEVLSGEKYRGPELEMWSLGVTLYTLIFGENPFFDIEETIQAVLHPPFPVSRDLMNLISHLLHPDPNLRCTLRDLDMNSWLHQPVNIEAYRFEDVVHCVPKEANPAKYYSDLEY